MKSRSDLGLFQKDTYRLFEHEPLVEISESAENLKVRPNVSDLKFAKLLTGIFGMVILLFFCQLFAAQGTRMAEPMRSPSDDNICN